MPAIYRKTGNSWQTVKSIYRKTGGSWQSVKRVWRKTAGAWQLVFQQALTPTIEQKVTVAISTNANQTRRLTGTLYRWNNASAVTYNFASGTDGSTFNNISGASGTSSNPATGQSNTLDQYTLTQSDVVANTTNYFIYVSKATNSTFGTEQTSSSAPESVVSFEMPRNITTLAIGSKTTTSIALSWTATTGSGSYIVYYGIASSPTTSFTTTTSTSATVTGLSAGTLYYFRVRPYTGSSGNGYYGNYSNEVSDSTTAISTPGSPTGLTATNVGSGRSYNDGRIDLSWTAPSNNGGSAITGYRIERSTDGSTFSVLVANTGSTSTSYSNTGLTSGQIYYYRVYAINSGGTGSVSNTANATATTIPQAPTIGTASRVSNTQASIGFTLNNNGGAAVTSLIVASSPTVSLSYSGTSSPVTVTGTFTLNQGYTFTVRAVNTNGSSFTSASSNQITINQAAVPTAPTNLQRSTGSGFSKTFTWSAPTSNGGSAITGYQYSVDGGSSWLPTSSSSSQSYTYSVAGSVSFSVRANNAAGAGAAATTTFTIPTVTTPTASSVTSTSATVSWTSTGQNNYSLTGVGPNSPYTGTTATSVNVTGLSAATSYSPVVTITSPTSDTVVSSAGTFTTGGGTVAPSNVQVTVTSSGFQGEFIPGSTLTASYTASGTTPFTSVSYQWARSTNNSTWSNVGTNSSTLATNSTYNNYYVRCTVTVTNSAGSASGTSPSYFMSDAI
jgi:hypothetical protein